MPLGRLANLSAMDGYMEEGPSTPPLEPESKIAAVFSRAVAFVWR